MRVSVAHFPPRYNALALARADLSCVRYGMYVYRYRYCLFRLWLVSSVWSAVGLFPLVLCCAMYALLSVVIWCTRVIMRCNRFPVLGGVVLPRALLCDCSAFYKRLLYCWLMV